MATLSPTLESAFANIQDRPAAGARESRLSISGIRWRDSRRVHYIIADDCDGRNSKELGQFGGLITIYGSYMHVFELVPAFPCDVRVDVLSMTPCSIPSHYS